MSNRNMAEGMKLGAVRPKKSRGLARLWNALHYSLAGLTDCYKNEAAFRQEVWLAALLFPAALVVPVAVFFKALLLGCVLLVLIVELFNSAIEAVVDKVMPEFDYLAKKAKDMGSAAVLLALVNLAVAWTAALMVVFSR